MFGSFNVPVHFGKFSFCFATSRAYYKLKRYNHLSVIDAHGSCQCVENYKLLVL